jgi:hypothetical protein
MMTLTQKGATQGQLKQLARVGSDAVEKALAELCLSKEDAQRVHGSADFAARIREATILALIELSAIDRYKNEEVKSDHGYFSGYRKPKNITAQIKKLRELFPDVGLTNINMARPDIVGAEGYFAIPRWNSIAPTYVEAVRMVLDALENAYGGRLVNYCGNQFGPYHLRQSAKSVVFWEEIGEKQEGFDILLVPAQFGIRHRGRSVRRAREIMKENECGLGAFAVGIMLLVHEDRLRDYDDLCIDCAGDEFNNLQKNDRSFDRAPLFAFRSGNLEFATDKHCRTYCGCGSASGFLVR